MNVFSISSTIALFDVIISHADETLRATESRVILTYRLANVHHDVITSTHPPICYS